MAFLHKTKEELREEAKLKGLDLINQSTLEEDELLEIVGHIYDMGYTDGFGRGYSEGLLN